MDMLRTAKPYLRVGGNRVRFVVVCVMAAIVVSCGSGNDAENGRLGPATTDDDDVLGSTFEVAEVRFANLMDGMCLVPRGLGPYGCDHEFNETCEDGDAELQLVNLPAFFIDIHEATWGDYRLCIEAGDCGENACMPQSGSDDLPAACVNAADAKAYCAWKEKRLPTDIEWERAARGLGGRYYPWGYDWCETCLNWCDGDDACDGTLDGFAETAPVASFPAGISPYGALNMSGNVWEMTEGNLVDGDEMIPTTFVRGGGFSNGEAEIPAEIMPEFYLAYRRFAFDEETMVGELIGFRCAVEAVYE
jgi:formylglycine-generating enzyme required for sulfatase activity